MKRSTILSLIAIACCIVVPLASAGTWRDDFEDGNLDGWGIVSSPAPEEKWGVEDGECSGQYAPAVGGMCSAIELKAENTTSWKDYSVVFKAKLVEKLGDGAFFGIFFRALPGGGPNDYIIFIAPDEKKVVFSTAVRTLSDALIPFDILEDNWYVLELIADGDHFEFYINDELIGSFDDASSPSGTINLAVRNAHAHFDDVVITGPEIPDGGPGSISVRQKHNLLTTWGNLKQRLVAQ